MAKAKVSGDDVEQTSRLPLNSVVLENPTPFEQRSSGARNRISRRRMFRLAGGAAAAYLFSRAGSQASIQGALWPVDYSRYKGIVLFAMTPMRKEGSGIKVDFDGLERNLKHFVSQPGSFCIAVAGAVGEIADLTIEEHAELVNIAGANKGDRFLIAGARGDTTEAVIAQARTVESAGIDAVLVLPSKAIGRRGDEAMLNHYVEVARSVNAGVIPYRHASTPFSLNVVKQLLKQPNIIGVKDQVADLGFTRKLVVETEGKMPTFLAHERMAPYVHLAGAAGLTSGHANYTLKHTLRLWDLLENGQFETAMKLSDIFAQLDELRAKYGDILLKYGLELKGLAGGPMRKGPAELPAEGRTALQKVLKLLEQA